GADESGIRTHASEETGALNQRLRPLGHLASSKNLSWLLPVNCSGEFLICEKECVCSSSLAKTYHVTGADESGIRTHASEETGALNQRLRPLGHLASSKIFSWLLPVNCSGEFLICEKECLCSSSLAKIYDVTGADESGIRTHASEETGALNQRLRPLGHLASSTNLSWLLPVNCSGEFLICEKECLCSSSLAKIYDVTGADESGIRTHASEETGALNQRLRPLGHLACSTNLQSLRPVNCSQEIHHA
uniref:Rho guanine nucleotide exchange factor 17 n=1 Tax=Ascaris lumbricoides TaxID=6252 RepID=A0A0M3IIK6_ASCLU